jgi:hypothetical protein
MEAIEALDHWEANYQRIEVEVSRDGERGPETVPAFTYVVRESRRAPTEGLPAPEYRMAMVEGATEVQLPASYTQFIESVGTDVIGGPKVVGTSTAGG